MSFDTTISKEKRVAICWDSKSPLSLLIPSVDDDKSASSLVIHPLYVQNGVGVDDDEMACLLDLLSSDANWKKNNNNNNVTRIQAHPAARVAHYLKALGQFIQGWNETSQNMESIELMKLMYAIIDLAHLYLLQPLQNYAPSHGGSESSQASAPAGSMTASMVRYLRRHHMQDFTKMEEFQQIFVSLHPEANSAFYWSLLISLVMAGLLEDAWDVLSCHSLCRHVFQDEQDQSHVTNYQERQALQRDFTTLRNLFLSAPLPGGRFEGDADSEDGNEDDNDGNPTTTPGGRNRHHSQNAMLIDGVRSSDYKLWEPSYRNPNNDDEDDDDGRDETIAATARMLRFNPYAARASHDTWSQAVAQADVRRVIAKVPHIRALLEIMRGNTSSMLSESHLFSPNWSQLLCAELLYACPTIRPSDIAIRASHILGVNQSGASGFNEVLLSILQGNAGRVVEALHLLGGGYGAALPACMTSLLCNALMDANLLQSHFKDLQMHMIISAAEAIQSSHASVNKHDVGMRLCTAFLLPHVKARDGDPRIVALLSDILSRHAPQTDAETQLLLDMVQHLVLEKRSSLILDGCTGMLVARYRQSHNIEWLIKGYEMEKSLFLYRKKSKSDDESVVQVDTESLISQTTCGRMVLVECMTISKQLLDAMLDADDQNISIVNAAEQLVKGFESLGSEREATLQDFRQVKVLKCIFEQVQAILERREDCDVVVASNITTCLDLVDGIPLAPYAFHWPLIVLACMVLAKDEEQYRPDQAPVKGKRPNSSFSVRGIKVVMERLTSIMLLHSPNVDDKNMRTSTGESPHHRYPQQDEETLHSMKRALCLGMARAIIDENSKRKDLPQKRTTQMDGSSQMYDPFTFSSHGLREQEEMVQQMLDI